ncbi:hypothetical protein K461DRAFT_316551 [Myriangium duriaei CBS 260.36]|uniref:Zn(2)-C6 fungal-type domain-containing protein n=1 Tax=Myriangium duriaei CBS 260.36 TaxID=1168546 RepID=A0A9P4IWS4_9PEZI|nr:hypothetical protein K461DRAFT_316551 [Myriangium duriaei CBS 260.36]
MAKSSGLRLYRACIRCRDRKSKCDSNSVGEIGRPPCRRCHIEGQECLLAGSRRGGDYSTRRRNKRPITAVVSGRDRANELHPSTTNDDAEQHHTVQFQSIQNPLEALQALAQVTDDGGGDSRRLHQTDDGPSSSQWSRLGSRAGTESPSLPNYAPVANGLLKADTIGPLLEFYAERYHPLLPVASSRILMHRHIEESCAKESFLFTSILTIATKDRPELEQLHKSLWTYMQELILAVALGSSLMHHVNVVEGLLILAAWVPHYASSNGGPDCRKRSIKFSEDSAAWTLVGLAVRQGYLLRLDRYSFRSEDQSDATKSDRNRLAWTFTYLADRQISIRMGQAFWCRGPGLSTRLTAADFPDLNPVNAYNDDLAALLQAEIELTTLFGNIHDILYASKSHTVGLMVRGDYNKYLDDSIIALSAWRSAWTRINVSANLKSMLDMSFEYLQLYIHAFAFQAVVCRMSKTSKSDHCFPISVMASPDGRHIYLAINAAKALQDIFTSQLDPVRFLRYLPVRFYLYVIHAVVFLFKTNICGAVSDVEHSQYVLSVQKVVAHLESASPSSGHVAKRHAKLLAGLLEHGKATEGKRNVTQTRRSGSHSSAPGKDYDTDVNAGTGENTSQVSPSENEMDVQDLGIPTLGLEAQTNFLDTFEYFDLMDPMNSILAIDIPWSVDL